MFTTTSHLHGLWSENTDSPVKKKIWAQGSVTKVMLTVFWDMKGPITWFPLEKKKKKKKKKKSTTVNSAYYCKLPIYLIH